MPRRVVILGDVMVDSFTTVKVRGPSPENSGVLVANDVRTELGVGGAGNVALGCRALGADVTVFGFWASTCIADTFKDRGVEFVAARPPHGRTPIKSRFVTTDGHQLLRVDTETPWTGGEDYWTHGGALQMGLDTVMRSKELPVVGVVDYDKGSVSHEAVRSLMYHQRAIHETYRVPLIVDPGRHGDWKRFSATNTIFKVNAKQCYQHRDWLRNYYSEIDLPEGVDWAQAQSTPLCRALFDHVARNLLASDTQYAYLVITLGQGGIIFGSRTHPNQVIHISSEHVHGADVCGAGDTVMAALLSYFAHQETGTWEWGNMASAVQYAQDAAQIAVRHRGVYTVRKEELPKWPARMPM